MKHIIIAEDCTEKLSNGGIYLDKETHDKLRRVFNHIKSEEDSIYASSFIRSVRDLCSTIEAKCNVEYSLYI
jgi:hypothetical protein